MTKTYVIRAGTLGPIKVGASADPEARMRQLQTGCPRPLRLVGLIDEDEWLVHFLIAPWRIQGEWFEANEEVCDSLRDVYNLNLAPTPKEPQKQDVTWNDYLELVRMGHANEPAWRPA